MVTQERLKELLTYSAETGIFTAEELTGTNRGHISAVCKGKRKTANSFIWKYCEPFIGQLPSYLKE